MYSIIIIIIIIIVIVINLINLLINVFIIYCYLDTLKANIFCKIKKMKKNKQTKILARIGWENYYNTV